jgi:MFS family permease
MPASRLERVTLLVAGLASFLTPFMGASTNVALPAIGRAFGLDAAALGVLATVYPLAAAMFVIPFGRLADIHGRRRVFVTGVAVHTITATAGALAPSAPLLLLARGLQGVGGAMLFGTSVAILSSVIPPQRRGAALGLAVAAVYLGLSLGPFAGGVLTDRLGWRAVFLVNALLGLVILAASQGLEGEWAEARGEPFDRTGSLLWALGLLALVGGGAHLSTVAGRLAVGIGVLLLAAFLAWEDRCSHPVLDLALFRASRVYALANLAALINYAATFAVGFLLSLYLQDVRGLSAQAAGLVLIAQPLTMTVVSPLAGRLADRLQSRIVASTGMAVIVVGLAGLSFLGEATPLRFVVAALLLLGAGFGLFSSPNTNAVMGAVDRRSYGIASATLATMRLCGQVVSMGLATALLTLLTPAGAGPGKLVVPLRAAFAAFAVLCVLGTLASLARGPQGTLRS